MVFVTVEEIKNHLRLDDIQSEDDYLTMLGDAAESLALTKINRTAEEVSWFDSGMASQFKLLALELVGSMYRDREADSTTSLNVTPVADALAKSLRKLSVS